MLIVVSLTLLCISVKLKNLKANHNQLLGLGQNVALCISVKLKNLKANHNDRTVYKNMCLVVYIRKVKKSESKSQPLQLYFIRCTRCVYP